MANQLDGATFQSSTGASRYRIDSATKGTSSGATLYSLSIWNGNDWQPACGTDPSGYYVPVNTPIPAVAFAGIWDSTSGNYVANPTAISFACLNAAVGKCIQWGYAPWATAQECLNGTCHSIDVSLVHWACVRMARADYCGDGVGHTVGETGVDAYDPFGLRTRIGVPGWSVEADWATDGAHCINYTRFTKADPGQDMQFATDHDYVAAYCPSRLSENDPTCANPSLSPFLTGFSEPLTIRPTVREESIAHR